MVRMNAKMAEEFCYISLACKFPNPELAKLLSDGFVTSNGCFFLVTLAALQTNATQQSFPDKTGYECFVNSIHIDNYCGNDYVVNACLFLEKLFESWRRLSNGEVLRAIVSKDEFGCVVKFHVVRAGESWIADNIETYEDAIIVADSSLISFFSQTSEKEC